MSKGDKLTNHLACRCSVNAASQKFGASTSLQLMHSGQVTPAPPRSSYRSQRRRRKHG